jgi:hypothetical protein
MRNLKIAVTAVLAAAVAMGCAPAVSRAADAAPAGNAGTARIVAWSVNSDGPDFHVITTGAVGDYGQAVTVHPNGTVDPGHTSELELNLTQGSFWLSIAKLDSEFTHAVENWPYDRATCSIHGTITATAPIVAGSGTRAYRGIAGTFTLTLSLDEDWIRGPACTEATGFQAQLLQIAGSGSVRL